jgi:hypothetical protein
MTKIFNEDDFNRADFNNLFLVQCSQCNKCARVQKVDTKENEPLLENSEPPQHGWRYRLICANCGHSKAILSHQLTFGAVADPAFKLPLWLQVECCGEKLWAHNPAHLAFIKAYIAADLRRNSTIRGHRSLVAKFPTWMKLAKNRQEILAAIEKLEAKLIS